MTQSCASARLIGRQMAREEFERRHGKRAAGTRSAKNIVQEKSV